MDADGSEDDESDEGEDGDQDGEEGGLGSGKAAALRRTPAAAAEQHRPTLVSSPYIEMRKTARTARGGMR